MNKDLSNRGTARLVRAIHDPVLRKIEKLPAVLELGVMTDDFGIKLKGLNKPIAQGVYMMDKRFTLADPMAVTSEAGSEPHSHTVPRPDQEEIHPGDLLLVGWTDSGDVVVLCVVVPS